MIILLIGLPGAGKASVGQALARKMHYGYVDMDEKVLKKTGFATVEDVYAHRKSLWKEYEMILSKELSVQDNLVIACTGGSVENELNFLYFQENAAGRHFCVYLHADFPILADRISHHHLRADSVDFQKIIIHLKDLHKRRHMLYSRHAALTIDTGTTVINDSVKLITAYIKEQPSDK